MILKMFFLTEWILKEILQTQKVKVLFLAEHQCSLKLVRILGKSAECRF